MRTAAQCSTHDKTLHDTYVETKRLHERSTISGLPFNFSLEVSMKALAFGVLLSVAAHAAYADVPWQEDFMSAHDRIEWNAGALYEGRFEDGSAFEIELAYPAPAGVSKRDADSFVQMVWEPHHYEGEPSGLFAVDAGGAAMRLKVLDEHSPEYGSIYAITLAPDRASGRGWSRNGTSIPVRADGHAPPVP